MFGRRVMLTAIPLWGIEETIMKIVGNGSTEYVGRRAHPTNASAGDRLRRIRPVKFPHLNFSRRWPDQSRGKSGNVALA